MAGSLVIGVLNVVGAGTGPVVNIVVVLMLVAGFLAAVAKALEEQLSEGELGVYPTGLRRGSGCVRGFCFSWPAW